MSRSSVTLLKWATKRLGVMRVTVKDGDRNLEFTGTECLGTIRELCRRNRLVYQPRLSC